MDKKRKKDPNKFVCNVCNKAFNRKQNLNRHILRHININEYNCEDCGKVFSRSDALSRHINTSHPQKGSGEKRKASDVTEDQPAPKRLKEMPMMFYNLEKIRETKMPKYSTTNTIYKANVKDLDVSGIKEILKALKVLFSSILKDITKFVEEQDLIRLSVQSAELDYPIQIPFRRKKDLTAESILSEIERVLQSFEQFVLDGSFEIDIIHIKTPKGKGRKQMIDIDLEKYLKEKQCFIQIKNKDHLCLSRALIVGKAKVDKHPMYHSIRMGRGIQTILARKLHEEAGVEFGVCGLDEIKRFQSILPEYQITVVSKEHFNAVVFAGPEADKQIYVYQHDEHYDVITSMTAFLNRNYYCHKCQKGYDHKESHSCNNVCHLCKKIHTKLSEAEWIHCVQCKRFFQGEICFDIHKRETEKGNSTCNSYHRCQECNQTLNMKLHKKEHRCGEIYCKICKDFYLPGHECHMQPYTRDDSDEEKSQVYIFWDLECMQDEMVHCNEGFDADQTTGKCKNCKKSSCGSFEHQPNLCVAQKVCSKCMECEVTSTSVCQDCGPNQMVFSGPNTVQDFCKWLFSKANKGATTLCHNFKAYDSYPILKYLYANGILPKVVPNGAKNMSVEIPACNIRMIDSINFLPTALCNLPKMFNFENDLAKATFPHLFNRKENQNVVLDHLPDVNYYNPDTMKEEQRTAFLEWYEKHKHEQFDFQKELLRYCCSDVDILRTACLELRKLFMQISNGIDPFQHCITIASACNLVFRARFLQSDTIGLIPAQGYCPEEKQSKKALKWLEYVTRAEHVQIKHARNGGEVKIGNYKVDGYYETSDKRIVLEYHGCLYHGCPSCFARETINPINDKTMEELYQSTLEKQAYIESQGYTYRCKWECEFDREIKENQHVNSIVEEITLPTPLEPRDAFFGGRTEAFTLYKEATEKEKINYYDVTSLYPFINKTGKYVLNHPRRIFDNFGLVEEYEGLVKCRVLPPRGLLLPVLPKRIGGKLLFALCRTCAEEKQQCSCQHQENERAFEGTWMTVELKKAIEKGYKILNIYEVWHFDDIAQYDPKQKSGGLFTEYINMFLKLKQEASGWPSWCITEQEKEQYITQYFETEGIQLEYSNIRKNPGLRSLAKLMLNSFWGKFGQRSNMTQVTHISSPKEYFDLLTCDKQEVTDINFVSEEMVELRWRYKDDFVETSARTNVIIAAYTTAQARLKLYDYLEQLQDRALYVDTDSIIFTTADGESPMPLGDYLGDLTNEVPDGMITHFVSGGPKNYAYKVATDAGIKTVCKVRGITLNYKNALDINFNTVSELVMDPSQKILTENTTIVRNKKTSSILTSRQNKEYKIVFDKRVLKENHRTIPYGY